MAASKLKFTRTTTDKLTVKAGTLSEDCTTITYTDDIVKNLLSIDEVTSSEETFSVFDEDASDSNFLEVYKEYGNYEGDDKVPDLDVIK